MPLIADELAELLKTVRTPGDFFAAGAMAMPLPRLAVTGVGTIAFPLLHDQAERLIAAAQLAPYGRGAQTLVDTDVRRTWQIGAEQVSLTGTYWSRTLDDIVAQVARGLGVTGPVDAELYKLLVYDKGSFFVGHRDTEKAPGMFAMLIIAPPSLHEGGELLVRHKGREVRLDLHCADPSEAAFAAFYADCVHEVLPVTSGCRLVLVYNLLRKGHGRLPRPPNYDSEKARLAQLLQRWCARKATPEDDAPEKLVYPLEHAYTPAELSFAALKGADAAAAGLLAEIAPEVDCDLHVALLTIEESGAAEYTGYSGSPRWGRGHDDEDDEEEEDNSEFEVGEVFDRLQTLSHWRQPDDSAAALGEFPFDDTELCPADALADLEPDKEYFQEATGNEGASFERSYRRAALVLWPRQRRLAVFNQAGLRVTLPYLESLAERWAGSGDDPASPLWREAHDLSGHMLRTWPEHGHAHGSERSQSAQVLDALVRLKDTARIDTMLDRVIATGEHGKGDNAALIQALQLLPTARARELLARMVAISAPTQPGACANLLVRYVRAKPLAGGLLDAAKALVDALPGNPNGAQPAAPTWRRHAIDVDFIVDLVSALPLIDEALSAAAADHLLAWPKTYGLDALLLPAVRRLAEQKRTRTHEAFARLRNACLTHLRARVAQTLEAPSDWARAPAGGCTCRNCNQLNQFLQNPGQQAWSFKAAEFDRSHVETSIRRSGCDVDCATDQRGRPYTLVCTKNQASYERRARQRRDDLDDLARLD